MSAAKKRSFLLMFMAAAMLISFFILVTAINGDSTLRIILAAGGLVCFGGLYLGVLFSGKRTADS